MDKLFLTLCLTSNQSNHLTLCLTLCSDGNPLYIFAAPTLVLSYLAEVAVIVVRCNRLWSGGAVGCIERLPGSIGSGMKMSWKMS